MEQKTHPNLNKQGWRALLFPSAARRPPCPRNLQVIIRTIHIVAMAMILGALPGHPSTETLLFWIIATLASGVLLLAIELWKTGRFLVEGAGVAVIVKLILLGLGNLFPGTRLPWYLAATVIASFGSHMSSSWRHFSFLEWRVVKIKGD